MNDEPLEKKYEKAFAQVCGAHPVFPAAARGELFRMIEQMARTDQHLAGISGTNQSTPIKAGFAAEEVITDTYNLDALLKNKTDRMMTDKYKTEWIKTGFSGNDPAVDMAITDKSGSVKRTIQSKILKSAEDTAGHQKGGMSHVKDGKVKYKDVDHLIGPTEQINPTDGSASIKDHAEAKAWAAEQQGDFVQAQASRNTADKATDQITHDGVSSRKLTKQEAENIAANSEEGKQIKREYRGKYQTASTFKQMGQAAKGAAAFSAVTAGACNTVLYCKMVSEGKMDQSEAVAKIVAETASAAADSALKAAGNTGVQSMLVRYGATSLTEQTTRQLSRRMLQSLVARSSVVTVGVVCGIDIIKDMVRLSAGKIDSRQFEERNSKNLLTTSAGVMGATLGTQVAGGIAATGAIGAALPFVGGIAGGMIAVMALQFAMENHIDGPYRELLTNTALMQESMREFQRVSDRIFQGQLVFEAYLDEEGRLNDKFTKNMIRIGETLQRPSNGLAKATAAIDRI